MANNHPYFAVPSLVVSSGWILCECAVDVRCDICAVAASYCWYLQLQPGVDQQADLMKLVCNKPASNKLISHTPAPLRLDSGILRISTLFYNRNITEYWAGIE